MNMKVKTKLRKFAAVVLLIGGTSACEDFMEYQPYNAGDTSSFWKTEADVKSALNAFYAFANSEDCSGRGHYWYENCSDNMITGRTNVQADRIRNFQMSPNERSDFREIWKHMYAVVAKANAVLLNVPKMTGLSKAVADNAMGQAYFMRGFAYLWLCPWLADMNNGGLPIMDENVKVEDLDMPRPTPEQGGILANYDMMLSDFRKAIPLLPSYSELVGSERGRPHKTAAYAFAARAALLAAQYGPLGKNPTKEGMPYTVTTDYFAVVIEMCTAIIDGLSGADKRELHTLAAGHDFNDPKTNSYGLPASNFSDLFRVENNFSKEYIYSMVGNGAAGTGPKFHGMSFYNAGFNGYNTWGYFSPTAELYKAFEDGDTRRDATILSPGQSIIHPTTTGVNRIIRLAVPGDAGDVRADVGNYQTGLINRKMHSVYETEGGFGVVYSTSGDGLQNDLGTVVMRYADVLLMKAEALIWTKGEGDAEAAGLINQVRVRAGLPANSGATLAQLKNERRCEFAFEFFPSRHLDLIRWGDAKEAYNKPVHGFVVKFKNVDGNPYVFDPSEEKEVWGPRTFDLVKNNVFPIHGDILSASQGILKQNKGY
ncbi:membrane protein [Bacteroidia bacterium]|nr:membrane protein [Bacteroidia bacterium]